MVRVVSWNINGIRTFKEDFFSVLNNLKAEIVCFQETKVSRDGLEEEIAVVDEYSSYFSFSKKRSGYSGVATYCRDSVTPSHTQEGLSGISGSSLAHDMGSADGLPQEWSAGDLRELDSEGRALMTQHKLQVCNGSAKSSLDVVIINVYCPRADPERDERTSYQLRFYKLLWQRTNIIRSKGYHVIIAGDINTSHKPIDHCDPDYEEFDKKPGRLFLNSFLLDCCVDYDSRKESNLGDKSVSCTDKICARSILVNTSVEDRFTGENRMIDTFRYFHQNQRDSFTCWNTKANARVTNYGTRIDYIFCNPQFIHHIKDSLILSDVMGSDHCPVAVDICAEGLPSSKVPSHSTKYYPEFRGAQQKLSTYFCTEKLNCLDGVGENDSVNQGSVIKRKPEVCDGMKVTSKAKQTKLGQYFQVVAKQMAEYALVDVEEQPLSGSILADKARPSETVDKVANTRRGLEDEVCPLSKASDASLSQGWNFLMKGPRPAPLCAGHKEPSVLRTVKKKGHNYNRQFYACSRGAGKDGDPNAQCGFFQWATK